MWRVSHSGVFKLESDLDPGLNPETLTPDAISLFTYLIDLKYHAVHHYSIQQISHLIYYFTAPATLHADPGK